MKAVSCVCCTGTVGLSYVNPGPRLAAKYLAATLNPSAHVCHFCYDMTLVKDFQSREALPVVLRLNAYRLQSILLRSELHKHSLDELRPFHEAAAIESAFFYNRDIRDMTPMMAFIASVLNAHKLGII